MWLSNHPNRKSRPCGKTSNRSAMTLLWIGPMVLVSSFLLGGSPAAGAADLQARLDNISGYALIQRGQAYRIAETAIDLQPDDLVIVMEKSKARIIQGPCTVDLQDGASYTVKPYPDCEALAASVVRVEPDFLPKERPAPGTLEIDPDAADRALERTLTEAGALLLAKGKAQVIPSIGFIRRESDNPLLVNIGDDLAIANLKTKRSEVSANLDFQVGLPWESQLELGIPYEFIDQSTVLGLGAAGGTSTSQNASGLGDFRIGLAKQLFLEKGAIPDVVLRVTYDTGSGKTDDSGVSLNGGFAQLRGGLSLLKRQDPLAFVAGLSYAKNYETNGIEPGDEFSFSLSAVLAASPETSLQFGFQQTFSQDTKINGRVIPESGEPQGILSVGVSSIIAKGVLLNMSVGAGLNEAAPDYFFQVSLPIVFDLF